MRRLQQQVGTYLSVSKHLNEVYESCQSEEDSKRQVPLPARVEAIVCIAGSRWNVTVAVGDSCRALRKCWNSFSCGLHGKGAIWKGESMEFGEPWKVCLG